MTPEQFVESMCTENKSLNVYSKHVIAETARYIAKSPCDIAYALIKACEVEL